VSVLKNVRADLRRLVDPASRYEDTAWNTRKVVVGFLDALGAWAVLEYRFRRSVRSLPLPTRVALKPLSMISRKSMEIIAGVSISSDAQIGPGFYIAHFGGVFVGPGVVAGSNLSLSQGVTIGIEKGESPTLGDWVYLAPGVKVFGPVSMGDEAAAGANAVVTKDVAPGVTVGGVPARPIGVRTRAEPAEGVAALRLAA
jgi:serine O-acetyltransferase